MTRDTDLWEVGTQVVSDEVLHTEKPEEGAEIRHDTGERFGDQMDLGADKVRQMFGFDRRTRGDGMGIEEVQKLGEMAHAGPHRLQAASEMVVTEGFILLFKGYSIEQHHPSADGHLVIHPLINPDGRAIALATDIGANIQISLIRTMRIPFGAG